MEMFQILNIYKSYSLNQNKDSYVNLKTIENFYQNFDKYNKSMKDLCKSFLAPYD